MRQILKSCLFVHRGALPVRSVLLVFHHYNTNNIDLISLIYVFFADRVIYQYLIQRDSKTWQLKKKWLSKLQNIDTIHRVNLLCRFGFKIVEQNGENSIWRRSRSKERKFTRRDYEWWTGYAWICASQRHARALKTEPYLKRLHLACQENQIVNLYALSGLLLKAGLRMATTAVAFPFAPLLEWQVRIAKHISAKNLK